MRRVFGRGKDPDCAGEVARGGQHCGAVPAGKDQSEPVLSLAEGVLRGVQEALGLVTRRGRRPLMR